jgi:hypothetical protein
MSLDAGRDPRWLTVRRLAWALGLAGLLPFVAHAGLAWWIEPPLHRLAAASQIVYAVTILTFVGAVHWGVVLAGAASGALAPRLIWSVVPSLYAFAAAQLVQQRALWLLSAGLVAALLVDLFWYRRDHGLAWFVPLRITLTLGAVVCLLLTAAAL